MNRSIWGRWAFVFGICTTVCLIFVIQWYHFYLIKEEKIVWKAILMTHVPLWWGLALFYPLIAWLVQQFPITRRSWLRSGIKHIAFAVVLSVVHSLLYLGVFYLLDRKMLMHEMAGMGFFSLFMRLNFALRILGYFLLATVTIALDFYQLFEEGALRASQLQAQLAEANLAALKMQLHPHFLFNTLNSISALLHRDVDAADRMIARLGTFLRMTLDNEQVHKVPLRRELEFMQCYLEIEQIRFQDRLSVRMDIDPGALDALIPNLLWQPVVENAIHHAIAPRTEPGHIDVIAKRVDGKVLLQVKDDGPGIHAQRGFQSTLTEGVGLANTRRRLQQLYGKEHWFALSNGLEGGLIVSLEIPYEVSESLQGEEHER